MHVPSDKQFYFLDFIQFLVSVYLIPVFPLLFKASIIQDFD